MGRKSQGRKTVSASPAESTDFGVYFEEIDPNTEEPMVEFPSFQKRKKVLGLRGGWSINTLRPIFLANLMRFILGELQDLLAAGMEFPKLEMVKIEAEHPAPDLDQLHVTLEKQSSTRFDILASLEE